MKLLSLILIFLVFSISTAVAQNQSPAEQFAHKIANRMKDSLGLSAAQCQSIYVINMQIHQQKMEKRSQYKNDPALINYIQQEENKRDSLYRTVLPEDKYLLYKSKKKYIVHNNF